MGLIFKKSIKVGPLKINFSKSGVGYSIGNKKVRHTRTATGKTYNTINLGNGLSYRTKSKQK